MNKIIWFIALCIFVFVTAFVISVDTSGSRKVKFTNQSFEIKNEGNEVVNDTNAKINLSNTSVKNKEIASNNSNVNISNTKIENQETGFNDSGRYSNQETNYNSDTNYYNQDTEYSNQQNEYNHRPVEYSSPKPNLTPPPSYGYKDIDWSTWKSNFVNKILDDSIRIKELDTYPDGSWFYYSFIVDDEGRISNVNVRSVYLTAEDKIKVANFIQGYQRSYLTKFPPNSKRKTAKISAIMMLSNQSTIHSKPSDFHDIEQVKYAR